MPNVELLGYLIENKAEIVTAVFSWLLWLPFARLTWLLLVQAGVNAFCATCWSCGLAAIIVAVIAYRWKWIWVALSSAAIMVASALPFGLLVMPNPGVAWNHISEQWGDIGLLLSVLVVAKAFLACRPDWRAR